jgi:V/A-type H+/Na+-transporting ATPase subunit D
MAEIKLTKNELRTQQTKLHQLERYLPTLQLKKALLQAQVNETRLEIHKLESELESKTKIVQEFAAILAEHTSTDLAEFVKIESIAKHYENIAGVDVPVLESVTFRNLVYDLFDTPVWFESAIFELRALSLVNARILIELEKKEALEKELREVSIRVNLFEKILIPRCLDHIKTIKVFLGDALLAAVSQAKVAKSKIELALHKNTELEF